jgi:hypothetical protein
MVDSSAVKNFSIELSLMSWLVTSVGLWVIANFSYDEV